MTNEKEKKKKAKMKATKKYQATKGQEAPEMFTDSNREDEGAFLHEEL